MDKQVKGKRKKEGLADFMELPEQPKRKAGRPKAELDETQLRKLAMMQCTVEEIASFFEVNPSTIYEIYSEILREGKEHGKLSLRRAQFKSAIDHGNSSMLTWCGKMYLGQKENSTEDKQEKLANSVDKLTEQMKEAQEE